MSYVNYTSIFMSHLKLYQLLTLRIITFFAIDKDEFETLKI